MGRIGDVLETSRSENSITFEWKIPKFISILEKGEIFYYSPNFKCSNVFWDLNLYLYRGIKDEPEGWIWIHLQRFGTEDLRHCIWLSLGIRKADGSIEVVINKNIHSNAKLWNRSKFLLMSELLRRQSQLAPSGALTITCTMWSNEPPYERKSLVARESQTDDLSSFRDEDRTSLHTKGKTLVARESQTDDLSSFRDKDRTSLHTKGGTILKKHFKDLLFGTQNHDVTLKVKDKEFKVHKNILAARSPVFAAMFTHNMKEKECGSISIDDCEPEAFGQFLHYIYTGTVEYLSHSNVMWLYYTGDKYDFPDLKEICVEYLKASLSTTTICDILTFAERYGEADLLQCAISFFSTHMEEVMITAEWQHFQAAYPVQASELCLIAVKSSYKKKERQTL